MFKYIKERGLKQIVALKRISKDIVTRFCSAIQALSRQKTRPIFGVFLSHSILVPKVLKEKV